MEPESLVLSLFRKEDFLWLTVQAVNMHLEGNPATLARTDPAQPAILIYHFPPQHTAEEAFFQNDAGTLPAGPAPVRAWLSGGSQLAFALPEGAETLPVTLEALLDWRALVPLLPPNALPPGATSGPAPAPPGFGRTALELPAGLILSPDDSAGWLHDTAPHERDGRYALWHTRLGRRDSDDAGNPIVVDSGDRAVRAVWGTRPFIPFRHSLAAQDAPTLDTSNDIRDDIVTLSSDFTLPRPPGWAVIHPLRLMIWRRMIAEQGWPLPYIPRPATARRLMLSALGAWANLESAWEYPTIITDDQANLGYPRLSLEQWSHIMAQGRDQYVRTVEKAFVCDPGHRVSIVTITEREFHTPFQIRTEQTPNGTVGIFGSIAYLRQRQQILVQQPLQDYTGQTAEFAHNGRELPYRRLRIVTRVTPFIDKPPDGHVPFWPKVNQQHFRFAMQGEDWDGQVSPMERPLLVVPLRGIRSDADWATAVNQFNSGPTEPLRTVPLGNHSVAFAANSPAEPGKTRLDTQEMTFEAQLVTGEKANALARRGSPPFLPLMRKAQAMIPAVNRILGREESVAIAYDDTYLNAGIDGPGNPGEVFLKLLAPPKLAVAADKAGGMVRPEATVEALSRNAGPVDKVASFKAGTIDTSAFDSFRLLGTIKLSDILIKNVPIDMNALREAQQDAAAVAARLADPAFFVPAPVLVSWPVYAPGANPATSAPVAAATRLVWKPRIEGKEFGPFFAFRLRENGQLYLTATLTTPFDGSPPTFVIDGAMEQFALDFLGSLTVNFIALRFKAIDGRKPDISAEGVDLVFQGPLTFVNTLRDILPADGFSDPPYVTVDGAGILAGYTLAVPSLGIGIFSLQNLSLSAQLSVPFVGKPASVRFAVSERHKPFLVSVTLFGGGGFFAMALSADGLEQIEAAIEFGGNISLNLGVASGGVYVMAGIYFSLTGDETKLTGYLRCGGYLSVLGIISISLEFYLGFTFRSKGGGGEVWGQASLKVAVKIAFFSVSVTLTVEKRFAGAAGDPTFAQVVAPEDWEEYCAAFS